ncbi:peptidase M16 [Candidatus Parcubacteria bacterium]|nr:MAG: peptidase M16 [Candidatus Parcubacteria bacterium]
MKNCETCQKILGWKIKETFDIQIPKSSVLVLEHIRTKARFVHIANDSKENTFVTLLKTVPENSTGVAHILEHTALAGSKKYPVRDPFFSMTKSSLATFLNAFTSNDWTAYPFSSPNEKDFYNLMSVYLDAVFYPRLDKLSFMQEGWRYNIENGKLKFDGVVYNEMKGVVSNPDSLLEYAVMAELYEKAPYHYNSGGEPGDIPSLSHEDLIAFHKKHYHPSNAVFYSFGNFELKKQLEFVNKNILDNFKDEVKTIIIKKENRRDRIKSAKYYYPINDSRDEDKHHVSISWLTANVFDTQEILGLEILEDILIGNISSPLRKSLLESGFGTELCDVSGFDNENLDTKFVIGLKDVKKENISKVQDLIIVTLEDLVKNKIDRKIIEATINKKEIKKKNITNIPYPYGIKLFLELASPLVHDCSLRERMAIDNNLKSIREKVDDNYFENLIKKYLLENKHRAYIRLSPDMEMTAKNLQKENEQLLKIEKTLNQEDKERIIRENNKLREMQEAEDDSDILPKLDLEDIEKGVEKSLKASDVNGLKVYKQNTRGISYLLASYDLDSINKEQEEIVPIFSYLTTRLGTKKYNPDKLANMIDMYTGDINLSANVVKNFSAKNFVNRFLVLSSYYLDRNAKEANSLISEIVHNTNFEDLKRIKMLLQSLNAQFKSSVLDNGHVYASIRALSPLSEITRNADLWHGLSQIKIQNQILTETDDNKFLDNLFGLKKTVIESLVSMAVIGNSADKIKFAFAKKTERENNFSAKQNLRQAVSVATDVSFVAAAKLMPDISNEDSASLKIASKLLSRGFLFKEIREKRGAYGGFCKYDYLEGNLWMGSYRDPNIKSTLEVIGEAKKYLLNTDFKESEIKETIISTSSEIEKPVTQVEQAKRSYIREISGLDDEKRRNFKEKLLKVSQKDIKNVAEKYFFDKWFDYSVAVISNKEKIEETNRELGENSLILESI